MWEGLALGGAGADLSGASQGLCFTGTTPEPGWGAGAWGGQRPNQADPWCALPSSLLSGEVFN